VKPDGSVAGEGSTRKGMLPRGLPRPVQPVGARSAPATLVSIARTGEALARPPAFPAAS
jgi:hypothetical protein